MDDKKDIVDNFTSIIPDIQLTEEQLAEMKLIYIDTLEKMKENYLTLAQDADDTINRVKAMTPEEFNKKEKLGKFLLMLGMNGSLTPTDNKENDNG